MRSALLAIVVVVFIGLAALACGAASECTGPGSCVAARLPASIVISAGRVSYRIARNGHLSRTVAARHTGPAHADWFPGTDTWYTVRHGHLLVGRGTTTVWRSGAEIAPGSLGLIAAGPGAVAFQMDHRLYLARYGGPARPVAHRELPLGWTAGGLYTYSYPRRQLLLRSGTGAIVKLIAQRPHEYEFDLVSRSLYFVDRGAVDRAHGGRTWRLGSLGGLGLSANTWLQPVGRLVALEDDQRLVLLRASGAEFASTPLPRIGREVASPDSSLVVAPQSRAVAFSAPFGQSHVTEVVYLLRARARAAVPIYTERGLHGICTQWAGLEWHGSWLLYSDTQGRLAAIDTAVADRTIELGGLVHSPDGVDARWGR